jgi:hypothetical protein
MSYRGQLRLHLAPDAGIMRVQESTGHDEQAERGGGNHEQLAHALQDDKECSLRRAAGSAAGWWITVLRMPCLRSGRR